MTLEIVTVPSEETKTLQQKIESYRKKYIRSSDTLVNEVFAENPNFIQELIDGEASKVILKAREGVWNKFLLEESNFNTLLIKDLNSFLDTPNRILKELIQANRTANVSEEQVHNVISKLSGEYAGKIAPYIYYLNLSNTQSRRSRAGATFQSVIYKIYDLLNYPFDSQKKAGKTVFSQRSLGKIVDSVLPGVEEYSLKRSKAIIGSMKTTLRERWQEVSEEMARTNIPQIHLLTVDTDISKTKAEQMNEHNITLVVLKSVLEDPRLAGMKNIISFEEFLFSEIPAVLNYWKTQL